MVSTLTFRTSGDVKMTTTKTWDGLNRLRSIASVTSAGSTISSHTYEYNEADQRTKALREDGSYWIYQYDVLGQVITGKKYWPDGTPMAGHQFEYAYDDIGNRKTTKTNGRVATYEANLLNQYENRTVPGAVDVTGTAKADATVTVNNQPVTRQGEFFHKALAVNNQSSAAYPEIRTVGAKNNAGPGGEDAATDVTGHEFVPQTPEDFDYDDDGNLTKDGRWKYTWDAENRLAAMTTIGSLLTPTSTRLQFAYDTQCRRLEKRVVRWGAEHWSQIRTFVFVYNDTDVLNVLDTPPLEHATRLSYVWGRSLWPNANGLASSCELLWALDTRPNAEVQIAPCNGNGDIIAFVEGDKPQNISQFEYQPFGQLLQDTGNVSREWCPAFAAKLNDAESGLLYYGFRYYSTASGRWTSRDPLAGSGDLLAYAFVRNSPIQRVDLEGLTDIQTAKAVLGVNENIEVTKEGLKYRTDSSGILVDVKTAEPAEGKLLNFIQFLHYDVKLDPKELQLDPHTSKSGASPFYYHAEYLEKHGFYHSGSVPFYDRPAILIDRPKEAMTFYVVIVDDWNTEDKRAVISAFKWGYKTEQTVYETQNRPSKHNIVQWVSNEVTVEEIQKALGTIALKVKISDKYKKLPFSPNKKVISNFTAKCIGK
jgi:RHS repeat-associated protein